MNRFFLLTLLSLFYYVANAYANNVVNNECSTCRMPCIVSDPNTSTSLIRAYTHTHKEYTITTLLNGIQGYFQATVSLNSKETSFYSTRVNLEHWSFSVLCKILSHAPIIAESKKRNMLSVHYKTFPSFNVLKTKYLVNYLQHLLTEKIAEKNEDSRILKGLKNRLRDAFLHVDVTGEFQRVGNRKDPFRNPDGKSYMGSRPRAWLLLDMKQVFLFNRIGFHLWDGDSRIFTYSVQVSIDRTNWKSIVDKKTGRSHQKLELPELTYARYIRINGDNNKNHNGLFIYSFFLELK